MQCHSTGYHHSHLQNLSHTAGPRSAAKPRRSLPPDHPASWRTWPQKEQHAPYWNCAPQRHCDLLRAPDLSRRNSLPQQKYQPGTHGRMVNIACIYTLRRPENGRAANIHIHKTCILAAHNPEAAGSSPVSATTTRPVFIGKQDGFFAYMEKNNTTLKLHHGLTGGVTRLRPI